MQARASVYDNVVSIAILCLSLILALTSVSDAACMRMEAFVKELNKLENELEKAGDQSWEKARNFIKKHTSHCDHAAQDEAHAGIISDLLAKDDQFKNLLKTIEHDRAFYKLVLRYAEAQGLEQIVRNARTHCPTEDKILCVDIEHRAVTVLNERSKK